MSDIIDPLIPPYRFERVQNRVYRGGYPKRRNFRFLRRQQLRTMVSLVPGDRDNQLADFCRSEKIERICIPVESPNENVTVTEQTVSRCLELMTDPTRAPLYIHCLDGSNVTGVVVMCLRKLQLWRVVSLQNEYLRFEQDGEIIPEESEFVDMYRGSGLELPSPYAGWLWPSLTGGVDNDVLPFPNGVHPAVPLTRIRPRVSTDICVAEPLPGFSRSATEPVFRETAMQKKGALLDERGALAKSTPGRFTATEASFKGDAPGDGSERSRRASAGEGSGVQEGEAASGRLHTSMSTTMLPDRPTTTMRPAERAASKRKSQLAAEIHKVAEPVLAALATDDEAADLPSVADSRNSSEWGRSRGHVAQASTDAGSVGGTVADEALFSTNDATSTSTQASAAAAAGIGEIREVALSALVCALAIEGLGM
ncbi:protein-tyrosine-phosphatase [Coemansia sp. RSA 552]|nr:protein-tyrosine-phosphatase [Coemansia sp. RSA 552]